MTTKIVDMKRRPELDWQHSSGSTMFCLELTFDDGQTGVVNARSETPWYSVGSEVVATSRGERDGHQLLKVEKPEFQNAPKPAIQPNTGFMNQRTVDKGDTDASIIASWAIDHAMKWPQANKTIQSVRETAIELMDLQHELKVHHKSKYP